MDTVMFANEMNRLPHLDKKLQYDFFINTVRSRRRFSPWDKKQKMNDLDVVKQYYGYSNEKARQALNILSPSQLDYIKNKLNRGGRK
jgi:hypothetical protein|tara:strand:- start:3479 stop:3739 length:261 start_codon:yes stop_codon:yes gene_type:complete